MRRWITATSIETLGDDLVVAKRRLPVGSVAGAVAGAAASIDAIDADIRRSTAAEARWLLAAQGVGIVAVRRVEPASGLLVTRLAGQHTLRTVSLPPPQAAAILSELASTVASLHRRGLVHGRLDLDHVVLAGSRLTRPVLCSPGGLSTVAKPGGGSLETEVDVLALAAMADRLRPTTGLASRRWRRTLARLRGQGGVLGALAAAELFRALAGRSRTRVPVRLSSTR